MSNYVYEVPTITVTWNIVNGTWNSSYTNSYELVLENGQAHLTQEQIDAMISAIVPNDGYQVNNSTVDPYLPTPDSVLTEDITFTVTCAVARALPEGSEGQLYVHLANLTAEQRSTIKAVAVLKVTDTTGSQGQWSISGYNGTDSGVLIDISPYSACMLGTKGYSYPILYCTADDFVDETTVNLNTDHAFTSISAGTIDPVSGQITENFATGGGVVSGIFYLMGNGYAGSGMGIGTASSQSLCVVCYGM